MGRRPCSTAPVAAVPSPQHGPYNSEDLRTDPFSGGPPDRWCRTDPARFLEVRPTGGVSRAGSTQSLPVPDIEGRGGPRQIDGSTTLCVVPDRSTTLCEKVFPAATMDILLYLMSNALTTLAGLIVLKLHLTSPLTLYKKHKLEAAQKAARRVGEAPPNADSAGDVGSLRRSRQQTSTHLSRTGLYYICKHDEL